MPSLKCQVKSLFPSLSLEANQLKDAAAKERYYLIKAVISSPKAVKRVCETRGRSVDYFEKWAKRLLKAKSLSGLADSSRKPNHSPKKISDQTEKWIRRLKKRHPAYGPERISFYLKKRHDVECPASTVYAALKRMKLISKKYRACKTKKHTRRYRRPWPGWLQLDIKYVPYLVLGKQLYQISAIDHHSSWRFIRIYEDRTEATVIAFLNELATNCPFEIFQIQTDNATEFTDKYSSGRGIAASGSHGFDRWCDNHDIQHKLIPIGEKELNGKVENSHKYDDEEFYSLNRLETFDSLIRETNKYCIYWNDERHTKTLGWKTPTETVQWAQLVCVAWLAIHKKTDLEALLKTQTKLETKTTKLGSITAPTGWGKNLTKPPNSVDRYLQYIDWEEKKYLKSILVWPTMSQIFPVGH